MIQSILNHINLEIQDLDQFERVLGLYEKSTVRGEKKTINAYTSAGQHEFLSFDRQPLIYHRQTEESTRENVESPSAKSTLIRETIPMRCVGYAKRVGNEDRYSPQAIARNVATKIGFTTAPTLRAALNMNKVRATVTAINTDMEAVWDDETDNIPAKLNSNFSLFAVDYEIELLGRQDCFAIVGCS